MRPRSLLALGLLLVAPAAHAVTLPVGVHDAYLHLDRADSAGAALRVDLAAIGVVPGYTIHVVAVGDWNAGPYGDVQHALLGLFSSDGSILEPTLLHRVPGAIGTGLTNYSGGTYPNGEPTDIDEDFLVPDAGVDVVVPAGATRLIVSVADIYYRDNSDPDGDLAVQIDVVSTAGVAGGGPSSGFGVRPNPFRGATALYFDLRRAAAAEIRIYDAAGRQVRRMPRALAAGSNRVEWDGMDDAGLPAACGVFFCELRVDGTRLARRLVRLR